MHKFLISILIILSIMISAYSTEIPHLIPFQGHLTSPKAGNPQQYEPVANGQYSILFTLYTAPVGGESKVWGPERHEKVVVVNGLVNVMIGSVMALPKEPEFFARPLYVGITIDADGNPATPDLELIPRQVLLPVMYAYVAGSTKTILGEELSNILTAKDSVLGTTGYDRDKDGKVDYANYADHAKYADNTNYLDQSFIDNLLTKIINSIETQDGKELRKKFTINLPNLPAGTVPLSMVLCPSGTFMMGSSSSEIDALVSKYGEDQFKNEGPQHQVTISKPFYIGRYEITQAQWQAVMGNNPSFNREDVGAKIGNNFPVNQVSWDDCQVFIEKLNKLGQGTFRLPTEAEWEYACRAGTITRFYWGEDTELKFYSMYENVSDTDGGLLVAGSKYSNAWGLYDMCGNVREWCQDRYSNYLPSEQTDPQGLDTGNIFVLRGCSIMDSWLAARSAWRCPSGRGNLHYSMGLRIVRLYP